MDWIEGTVVHIVDHNTFDMRVEVRGPSNRYSYRDQERVQLRRDDIPNPNARPLNQSLLHERVRVDVHARDVYGRVVGDVRLIGPRRAVGW